MEKPPERSDLERALRIIDQSPGGCPQCGWIWWDGGACLSCETFGAARPVTR